MPRWLVDDATLRLWPGCWPPTAASPCSAPKATCSTKWPAATTRAPAPTLGVFQGPRRGPAESRPPRPTPEYVERPCLTIGLTVQPEVLRGLASRPGFSGRGLLARSSTASPRAWSATARQAPHLCWRRWPTATPGTPGPGRHSDHPGRPGPDDAEPAVLTLDQAAGDHCSACGRDLEPRLAAGATWPIWPGGRQARRRHLPPCRPPSPRQPFPRRLGHPDRRRHRGRRRPAGRVLGRARPGGVRPDGRRPPIDDARWLLDWITPHRPGQFTCSRALRAAPRGRFPEAHRPRPGPRPSGGARLRRVDADSSRPRAADPSRGSWSSCTRRQPTQNRHNLTRRPVLSVL